tara:strand:+ start:39 stop:245 length:207 start_codon:yes stop_codon:yes gene_type:complete
MRNEDCIFLNTDESVCTNKTKYTVDIWHDPDPITKTRTMSMSDFDCCEKHYQEALKHPHTHIKNVRVK